MPKKTKRKKGSSWRDKEGDFLENCSGWRKWSLTCPGGGCAHTLGWAGCFWWTVVEVFHWWSHSPLGKSGTQAGPRRQLHAIGWRFSGDSVKGGWISLAGATWLVYLLPSQPRLLLCQMKLRVPAWYWGQSCSMGGWLVHSRGVAAGLLPEWPTKSGGVETLALTMSEARSSGRLAPGEILATGDVLKPVGTASVREVAPWVLGRS
jgi:hypothetical protein